ncbi:MAG: hypothetical protein IKJ67_03990 [Bacteroidales bacterium]|nr:hypothetical protein [Bacteroidales bacterium]
MELENLKQQWNALSEEVKKQKILNKKLIDNAVDAKMDTIMKYNLVGIACCVLYVLLAIFYPPTIFSKHVFMYLNVVIPFVGLWQCASFYLFLKMKHYRNDVATMERYLIKYQKSEKLNYVVQCIIMPPFVFLFTRDMFLRSEAGEIFTSIPFSAIAIFVTFVVVSAILGTMWYFKKIKDLKESVQNLKEFEEEIDK